MDQIDLKILSLLEENARMPLKQLAENIYLSSPATAARLEKLETEGIISGYPDNTVRPEKTITREEFASLLVRVFGFKTELTESPFEIVVRS